MFAVMANPAILKHVGRKCSDVEVNTDAANIQPFFWLDEWVTINVFALMFVAGEICARQINV